MARGILRCISIVGSLDISRMRIQDRRGREDFVSFSLIISTPSGLPICTGEASQQKAYDGLVLAPYQCLYRRSETLSFSK